MFGSGRKKQDISLTKKEVEQIRDSMSRSERKVFDKRQEKAEEEKMWNAMCWGELFSDD